MREATRAIHRLEKTAHEDGVPLRSQCIHAFTSATTDCRTEARIKGASSGQPRNVAVGLILNPHELSTHNDTRLGIDSERRHTHGVMPVQSAVSGEAPQTISRPDINLAISHNHARDELPGGICGSEGIVQRTVGVQAREIALGGAIYGGEPATDDDLSVRLQRETRNRTVKGGV